MIKNRASFDTNEIYVILGEHSASNLPAGWKAEGISIDTRTLEPGNLFIALKGETSDGHLRVADALEKGAAGALVSTEWYAENQNEYSGKFLIPVEDTLIGMGKIAKFHRNRFDFPVVAIGGSNGKTTTKEMIAAVLSRKYNLLKTHENFNNQLGVPLMIFAMDSTYTAAAIEIGTNEPGEIYILSEMLQPTHGIITNIGKEHLEKLIDLDGVEMEETYLFGYLKKKGAKAFINLDDTRLANYSQVIDEKITFGKFHEADVIAGFELDSDLRPIITFNYDEIETKVYLKTYGIATALNAMAAGAVGFGLDVEPAEIKFALENFETEKGHGYARMFVEEVRGVKLINDCYNANPSSMEMSLETLKLFPCEGKRVAVLGDMRELGDSAEEEHISVINKAVECADKVLVTGDEMKKAVMATNYQKVKYYSEKIELAAELKEIMKAGDAMLVKGSRGMKMEEVIENFNG